MEYVGEEGRQEDLARGQSFDEPHGRPTARTRPRRAGRDRGGRFRGRRSCYGERLPTLSQLAGARARGEKTEIPDADEALREHVHEEVTEKLADVERQRLDLVAVAIVLP